MLLLDEPLSALDANLREDMRVELKRIQHQIGITTVFVTHDQSEALAMSDRIVVMSNGRVEQIGTPQEVYNTPASEFVSRFLGISNILPATCQAVNGHELSLELPYFGKINVPREKAPIFRRPVLHSLLSGLKNFCWRKNPLRRMIASRSTARSRRWTTRGRRHGISCVSATSNFR